MKWRTIDRAEYGESMCLASGGKLDERYILHDDHLFFPSQTLPSSSLLPPWQILSLTLQPTPTADVHFPLIKFRQIRSLTSSDSKPAYK